MPYLCDVSMSVRPLARTLLRVSQSNLRASGSMPVVGSSRNTISGSPIKDIAVLNFLLFPPLKTKRNTLILFICHADLLLDNITFSRTNFILSFLST